MPSELQQETVSPETREKVLKFIKQGQSKMESAINHDLLKMLNQYDSTNGTVQPTSTLNDGDHCNSSLQGEAPHNNSNTINTGSSPDQDTMRNGLSNNGIIPMDLQTVKLDLFQQLSNNNPQSNAGQYK
ncbi:uncharacterized protein LOC132562500 [Ylistrum balloti]|uniref:uncharacterized protein LOC132562500 n=1 Tax=Ylistrum balloti TaxID=509963 RepID=UPI0029058B9A|nr:uncharacterized protein LOC132562500 [Ylistrum balloti]